jgi:septal ring factor EnvC (AmiA/AmiB activator)
MRHRLLVLACLGALGGSGAHAEEALPDSAAQKAQLQAIQGDMAQSQAKRDALRRQAQAQAAALAALQDASVAAARIAQQNEQDLTDLQAKLKLLEADTRAKLAAVQATHAREAALLAALQRVAIEPPAALVFSPGSPLDSVHSGMLLAAIVPRLRAAAADLQQKLAALDASRRATETAAASVAEKQVALMAQQEHLADLMTRKKQLQSATRRAAAAVQRRLLALSTQAVDLEDLIQKLDAERVRRIAAAAAAERRRQDEAKQRAAAPPVETAAVAPGRAHSLLEGSYALVRPAAGQVTKRFGQSDGFITAKGITIATRPGAEVVAPYDGQILFAGPFRGYGQILIIEHPGGYDSLLAGCDHIDGVVGQTVKAGEPVARMRSGAGSPSLYFEWRHKDQPIDPAAWMAIP